MTSSTLQETIAKELFDIISGDPENDETDPYIQKCTKRIIEAIAGTIDEDALEAAIQAWNTDSEGRRREFQLTKDGHLLLHNSVKANLQHISKQ